MKRTIFNVLSIIVGIAMIIVGVNFNSNPAGKWTGSSPTSYTFGADYYTEQYEATRIAANNISATARTIGNLSEKLANYVGFAFIFAGILVCLSSLKKLVVEFEPAKSSAMPEAPIATEPTNPTAAPEVPESTSTDNMPNL